MKSATYATEVLALAACAKIDAHLGYPKIERGEIGPPVLTERFTTPIELADGTFAVQMTDTIRTDAKLVEPIAVRDLGALRKLQPDEMVKPVTETVKR